MKFIETAIPGVFSIEPLTHKDERGFFERRFCEKEFRDAGIAVRIAQINRSYSNIRGTLRGLHYQVSPMNELKIVQCFRGKIFDVAVDLRKESPEYLKWHAEILSQENGKSLCIPKGCAHGYQTLTDESEILYFTDQFYSTDHERSIHYRDPSLNIRWPLPVSAISEKDRSAPFIGLSIENKVSL
jgi:dTDP-4-dehydrorhamnose 3,5-epimerase